MTFDKATFEFLREPVKKAAEGAAWNWHGLLEAEEIESELWIEVMQSPATEESLRGRDANALARLLAFKANRVCAKERTAFEHYSGQYQYSVGEVKDIAEKILTREGVVTCEVIDFMEALEKLIDRNPGYADLFLRRYADGETFSDQADRSRLSRALTKFTDFMNWNRRNEDRAHEHNHDKKWRCPKGYDSYEGDPGSGYRTASVRYR